MLDVNVITDSRIGGHMNRMIRGMVVFAATAATTTATPAFAVGRADCDNPSSRAERKVCNDARLLRLHNKLRAETERKSAPSSDVEAATADQERWIARRDSCWTKRCIARAYALRLERIDNADKGRP
jgi:uncharacterized protein